MIKKLNELDSPSKKQLQMIIIDIPLNDDFRRLGVTEFKKQGQSTLLLLCKNSKNNKATAVIFPISKDGPYNTLLNFENAAKAKLDKAIIEEKIVADIDQIKMDLAAVKNILDNDR